MYKVHVQSTLTRFTLAAAGSRQVAMMFCGGLVCASSCFTNSNPIPLLAPVMRTEYENAPCAISLIDNPHFAVPRNVLQATLKTDYSTLTSCTKPRWTPQDPAFKAKCYLGYKRAIQYIWIGQKLVNDL